MVSILARCLVSNNNQHLLSAKCSALENISEASLLMVQFYAHVAFMSHISYCTCALLNSQFLAKTSPLAAILISKQNFHVYGWVRFHYAWKVCKQQPQQLMFGNGDLLWWFCTGKERKKHSQIPVLHAYFEASQRKKWEHGSGSK